MTDGSPRRVRFEHLDDALGIGERRPRISWQLPEGAARQEAAEVALDEGTSSGWVPGSGNVLVAWPGRGLASRERREVRVRVRTDLGESPWSEPVAVETGLLDASDWTAEWVRPVEPAPTRGGFRPAYLLRGDFSVDRPVVRARLYATANGIYEAELNGERVGDIELAPGFTEYATRTQVQTYDVTGLVRTGQEGLGQNVLGVVLADGWFRGSVGMPRSLDQFGDRTAFLAQVHLDHDDGTTTVVGTDARWGSARSWITAADLIEGQAEDLTLWTPGWSEPAGDEVAWDPVEVAEIGFDHLVASPAPPVRAVEEIRPVAVSTPVPGRQVVDLGQNVNGRVRLTGLGPAGTRVTLTHGEALGPDGDVRMDHLTPDVPFLTEPVRAGQVDTVVSAGRSACGFEPSLTTHGFRYVRVEGHPETLTEDDVTGVVVHTDLRRTGSFACSDDRLNALHTAAEWSFRGNACDIPTDCPTRERAGWTGDWQLYLPIASFLYDVAGFSTKWLRDVAVGQFESGILGNMAPMPPAERTGFLEKLNGSAGWGDASVLVPWEIYQEYGDAALLEEMWPVTTRWLTYAERSAASGRHADRVAARPEPAPHERWLWDTGFHWGEWLVPGEDPSDFPAFMAADKSDVATAYLAWSSGVAVRIAGVLERGEEAERYSALRDRAIGAWRAEFVDADGRVKPDTQANLVRALSFGLVPEERRPSVADRLAELVRANDTHLATGFLATPDLLPVLADGGHLETAYDLLLQDTAPSWLVMIERGATTMWERWEGVDADGVPHESLNHYSKGAVIGFLHRYVAGLQRLEPTWRRFRVDPRVGGGLTCARAEHESPHGTVSSSWSLDDGVLSLEVIVPPGCTAEVVLSGRPPEEVGPGTHHFAGRPSRRR